MTGFWQSALIKADPAFLADNVQIEALSSSGSGDYEVNSPQAFQQESVDIPNFCQAREQFILPKTAQELKDRLLKVSHWKRIQDWADLTGDLCRGLLQRECLAATIQAGQPDEDDKVEGVTVVWNSGLFGWRGSKFLARTNQWNPLARRFFEGTYHEPEEYLRLKGYRVREAWGRGGIQTGDLEGPSKKLETAIEEELYDSNLMVIVGHSFGAIVAQDYAVRHPDKARKMIIISGAAPYFPDAVNFWVVGTVLLLHGTHNFGRLRENAQFMQSNEAQKIRFVNITDRNDRVFRGPNTPGETRSTTTGHSGLYFDQGNLDFIDSLARSEIGLRRSGKKSDCLRPTSVNTAA